MTSNLMTSHEAYTNEHGKLSPFHERQAERNVRGAWAEWNGYKFAEYYYDAQYEYFCVRNQCGTYDISPMQKYMIEGEQALAMLNRMVTRDLAKCKVGRAMYTVWCTEEGRLIDDGAVFRLADDKYMLTCGAPMIAWLRRAKLGFTNVTVTDVTDDIAALSIQGPTSYSVLRTLNLTGDDALETLKLFDVREFTFNGKPITVSRTGFTGDLGYELWVDPAHAIELWDAIYAQQDNYGVHPYGEAATDMLRIEAGFIMPFVDFNEAHKTIHFRHDHSPLELNLDWLVNFKKPMFNGKKALLEEAKTGPEYRLVKLDIEGNKPAEEAWLYADKNCTKEIGYVTSAMWSPVAKANIALAMVKPDALKGDIYAEIYYTQELRQKMKVAKCELKDKPFWAPERARAVPPFQY